MAVGVGRPRQQGQEAEGPWFELQAQQRKKKLEKV